MTASPATRRRASAKLVAVAAARRLPSRISTTSEDANSPTDPSPGRPCGAGSIGGTRPVSAVAFALLYGAVAEAARHPGIVAQLPDMTPVDLVRLTSKWFKLNSVSPCSIASISSFLAMKASRAPRFPCFRRASIRPRCCIATSPAPAVPVPMLGLSTSASHSWRCAPSGAPDKAWMFTRLGRPGTLHSNVNQHRSGTPCRTGRTYRMYAATSVLRGVPIGADRDPTSEPDEALDLRRLGSMTPCPDLSCLRGSP